MKDKIVAVVTDNGANMVANVHKAGWAHYPSFAHTLNLVVKDLLKAVPDLLISKRKPVKLLLFFTTAPLLQPISRKFKSSRNFLSKNCYKQLRPDGTLHFTCVNKVLCLSQEEWSEISLSLNALRLFDEVTRKISTE